MSDLSLQDLIRIYEPNVENIKFRIARHVMKGRGWEGFDELIRFDDDLLTIFASNMDCLLYTSPSPRDFVRSRMPSSA